MYGSDVDVDVGGNVVAIAGSFTVCIIMCVCSHTRIDYVCIRGVGNESYVCIYMCNADPHLVL